MMLQMSRRDGTGTWKWLQTSTGVKIGVHFHPCPPNTFTVVDERPRVEGPRVQHGRKKDASPVAAHTRRQLRPKKKGRK